MKRLSLFFVLLAAGFSYSQTFREVEGGMEQEISVCANWEASENPNESSKCVEYKKCDLQLYTMEELVVVACQCQIRRSTGHPDYEFNARVSSWTYYGAHQNRHTAEEIARSGCTRKFNLENKNPEHWATTIDCGTAYRYLCEDGSTQVRRAGASFE